jgi:hypothetical protein
MEKTLPKTMRHVGGLGLGDVPLEVVAQRDRLERIADGGNAKNVASESFSGVEASESKRVLHKAKLTCKTVNFVLEFPVYDVDVQEKSVNLQVMPEFSLSSEEKLEFMLEAEGSIYHVMFLGLTVDFDNCHAVVFVKIPEA